MIMGIGHSRERDLGTAQEILGFKGSQLTVRSLGRDESVQCVVAGVRGHRRYSGHEQISHPHNVAFDRQGIPARADIETLRCPIWSLQDRHVPIPTTESNLTPLPSMLWPSRSSGGSTLYLSGPRRG